MAETDTIYDEAFYQDQALESLQSARLMLSELFRYVQPRSVLDVGCGIGSWLRAARELGAADGLGVDGGYINRRMLMVPEEMFLPVDLAEPGLDKIIAARRAEPFDLVMCLEVAEHLPYQRSASFVEELCRLGDLVLFSAAIPFQHGTGHINEQWPELWAMLFRSAGYLCFDFLRPAVWTNQDVKWWYAQNVLVFVREGSDVQSQLPAAAAVGNRGLAWVHPEAWLSAILNQFRRHCAAARHEEPEDFRALQRAWGRSDSLLPVLRTVERARNASPGARDVFPFTRTDVDNPDRLLHLEAEVAEARAGLATASAERDEMSRWLDEARADIAKLGQALAAATGGAAALQRQLDEARAENERLRKEVDVFRVAAEQQARLQADNETLAAANATLHAQITGYMIRLARSGESTDV